MASGTPAIESWGVLARKSDQRQLTALGTRRLPVRNRPTSRRRPAPEPRAAFGLADPEQRMTGMLAAPALVVRASERRKRRRDPTLRP